MQKLKIRLSDQIQQSLYEHGGSRIWIEVDNDKTLLCDTYHTKELSLAVFQFIKSWTLKNDIFKG